MVTDAGDDFIFTCKATSHKALYDFIDGAELSRRVEKIRRRNAKETFRYRWIEAVPIRDGKDALLVNWIGFEIVGAKGKVKYSVAWVTSLPVSQDTSPKSSPAAGRDGKSRTRASTFSKTTAMGSNIISGTARSFSP
jgi:hypothetical protein